MLLMMSASVPVRNASRATSQDVAAGVAGAEAELALPVPMSGEAGALAGLGTLVDAEIRGVIDSCPEPMSMPMNMPMTMATG